MAYVTPNSTIEIFKNIPWDNTYEHTLYFVGNNTYPASHFQNLLFTALRETANLQQKYQVRKYEAYSYQRKSKNSIKINVRPDEIYDYNYMRFKNTSHGNKWFYAFINDVEYVNENTALIHYEIDVLQTYLDEMNLKMSYIEREHSETDEIGENLEPEPLDFGEYVYINSETPWNFNDYSVILFYANADKNDVEAPDTMTITITDVADYRSESGFVTLNLVADISDIGTNDFWFGETSGTESGHNWRLAPNDLRKNECALTIEMNTSDNLILFPSGSFEAFMYSLTYGGDEYLSAPFTFSITPSVLNTTITFNKVVQ